MSPYIVNADNSWEFSNAPSVGQNLNMSNIDVALFPTQPFDAPRIPGGGAKHVIAVAPDFDDTLVIGDH